MNKKIILFDIDYTMFDTTRFKGLIADILKIHFPFATLEIVDEVYYEVRKQGHFDPKLFAHIFVNKHVLTVAEEEIERIWYDTNIFKQALYPEVVPTLKTLASRGDTTLGIFSSGSTAFQLQKISSLAEFFVKEHIHIASLKEVTLPEVMAIYKGEEVILVDDLVTILQKAKSLKPELFAIWMKRGKFAVNGELPADFQPDAIVTSLTEIIPFFDNELI